MKKTLFLRILRIGAFALAALMTAAVLVAAVISFTGRREWERVRKDLVSRGEPVEISEIVPRPIPPEENFFADPFWDSVFGKDKPEDPLTMLLPPLDEAQQERLRAAFPALASKINKPEAFTIAKEVQKDAKERALTRAEAELLLELTAPASSILSQIEELGRRPDAVAPLHYEKGFAMPLPHLTVILKSAQILSLRSIARAGLGDPQGALNDTLLIFRLGHVFDHERVLISFLVSISINNIGLDVVERVSSFWNAKQIARVNAALAEIQPVRQMAYVMAGERALGLEFFKRMSQLNGGMGNLNELLSTDAAHKPSVWLGPLMEIHRRVFLDHDTICYARILGNYIAVIEKPLDTISPAVAHAVEPARSMNYAGWPLIFSRLVANVFSGVIDRAWFTENRLREAKIACAIRQFYLAHQMMPVSLEELVPDFLGKIPHDVITGKSMNYRRTNDTGYVLWSVGWNEIDDRGTPPTRSSDLKSNDWVWNGNAAEISATSAEKDVPAPY